ncbi:MAG: sodium:calcium antiporter [Candidatus Wildermuthbacteria bacterium]|nr:sodium:calcium antiporter [Candidatus Wildermuthbacteria bacterium]
MKWNLLLLFLLGGTLGFLSLGILSPGFPSFSFVFLLSGILLFRAASIATTSISHIASYLQWREFVMAFFVMALSSSIPNLFVGISSALDNVPELSFGDIVGNNVIDLTLIAALAVFLGKGLEAHSSMAQTSSLFTTLVALLPLVLILDGALGRGDAILLLFIFFCYSVWLLHKRKLYAQEYRNQKEGGPVREFRKFFRSIAVLILALGMVALSAEGVVRSAKFFATSLDLPISVIGILVVGLGSALPELYFTLNAAKRGNNWIILGELMGSVVTLSTLILGIVALINPIEIVEFSPFAIARFFLIVGLMMFFITVHTGKKITRKEAVLLGGLYILFVAAEIIANTK